MRKSWWKWALGALGLLIVLGALFGEDETPVAKTEQPPKVTLEVEPSPAVVRAKTVTVSGTVTPARATVELTAGDAQAATADVASDGTFSADLELPKLGDNPVDIDARVGSRRAVTVRLAVERRLSPAEVAAKRERIRERRAAVLRARQRREAARAARAERKAAKQAAAAERAAAKERAAQEAPEPQPEAASGCDPNYSGCVPIASDVDCSGGTGDGPAYTGPVTVIGSDIYDLDSDSDGTACE